MALFHLFPPEAAFLAIPQPYFTILAKILTLPRAQPRAMSAGTDTVPHEDVHYRTRMFTPATNMPTHFLLPLPLPLGLGLAAALCCLAGAAAGASSSLLSSGLFCDFPADGWDDAARLAGGAAPAGALAERFPSPFDAGGGGGGGGGAAAGALAERFPLAFDAGGGGGGGGV